MSKKSLVENLKEAIMNGRDEEAREVATEVLKAGIDPVEVIEKHLSPAMIIVGKKFEAGEFFLTHLMLAAEAMKSAVNVLTSRISIESKEKLESKKIGTVVIGTVKGDIHDIGKNIVISLLEANGFGVYDLGKDVKATEFIGKAVEFKADIIALSALMTVTMPYQAEVIKFLKEMGLREKFRVMIGGAPTTQAWSDEIGADGWGPDAPAAVTIAKRLLGMGLET